MAKKETPQFTVGSGDTDSIGDESSELEENGLRPSDFPDDFMAALTAGMIGGGFHSGVLREVLEAKRGDPSGFASHWEEDESGIEEVSMEELEKDPHLKILWAAENNLIEEVTKLLDGNADLVDSRDSDQYSPLHRASYNDHVDMVKLLIERSADIEAETADGWRPVHSASRWSNDRVVSLLLECGADVNAQTHGGQTALHLAAANQDSLETLHVLLLNDNILPDLKNSLGETAKQICMRTSLLYKLFEVTEPSVNVYETAPNPPESQNDT